MKNKVEIFSDLAVTAADTYRRKNADYGDSFAKTRALIPNAILVRLHDKLNRLTTLMTGASAQVKDESIEDTLLDLANYALMELTERLHERQTKVVGCEYQREARCMAQKDMPPCDIEPGTHHHCSIRKGSQK